MDISVNSINNMQKLGKVQVVSVEFWAIDRVQGNAINKIDVKCWAFKNSTKKLNFLSPIFHVIFTFLHLND